MAATITRREKRLTAATLKRLGPGRHLDGNGLYLEVNNAGGRSWILRSKVNGRRRDIGLGGATWVSLAEARELAARLRKAAREGRDPILERDGEQLTAITFEQAARQVHADQIAPVNRNAKHVAQWITSLETYAFPHIGKQPIGGLRQADLLRVLAPIWNEKPETARRVKQRLGVVFDWARTAGLTAGVNPINGIAKGLGKQRDKAEHHRALPWSELPALMDQLNDVPGVGTLALRFTILTAARSGETRGATWGEIDLDAAMWSIPGERMKSGEPHRVPLTAPAMDILARVGTVGPSSTSLLFPGRRGERPMSDMTLAAVLKRLGYGVTVHGFRSTFRDWAAERTSFPREVAEAALAHRLKNKVEAAYRRSDLFEKRRELMDLWAGFAVGAGGNVVSIAG